MIGYINDKLSWYSNKIKEKGFFLIRSSKVGGNHINYLMSEKDWRHTVFISCNQDYSFRLDLLYVNIDNSFHYSENQFEDLLKKIEEDLKNPDF